jgi:hypothetical protein
VAPALAAAAACVLAVGLAVHDGAFPGPNGSVPARSVAVESPAMVPVAISDTQLYSDVYAMEQSFEPSASASIGVLFEPEGAEASNPDADRVDQ